jgi:CDP-diacylglycerol--glycerol-3-phosphate 3-phosphatidyltransferase
VATIYLGWHYVVDDIAGVVIAFLATWIGAIATGHEVPGWRRGGRPTAPPRAVDAPPPSSLNVPNVLSACRILMAPGVAALVLAHPDGSLWAAALFAAGGLTDVVDGHLARSRGLVTSVGKLLDPFADKLLVIAALASLVAVDRLALWVVAVIAGRELLVTLLRAHAVRRGVVIAAGSAGKAKMFLQVAMVLALMAVSDPSAVWVQLLVAATVTLTVVSGLAYLRGYLRGRALTPVSDREHLAEPAQLVA